MSALGMELLTEEGKRPVPCEMIETGELAVDDFQSQVAQRRLESSRDLDSKRAIGLSLQDQEGSRQAIHERDRREVAIGRGIGRATKDGIPNRIAVRVSARLGLVDRTGHV